MRNLILELSNSIAFLFSVLFLVPQIGHSQDLLVTKVGDSINCQIINIEPDTVRLKTKINRGTVETHYSMDKVSDIQIGFFERVQTDTTAYYLIETYDGNHYIGEILSNQGEVVRVRTTNVGEISIKTKDILSMKRVGAEKAQMDGGRWFDYLQSSRYFYNPSGYGLKKGDAYYQNVWIFFNQFSMGFSDVFSAGVGMVPLFLFGGVPTPVWVTPKFSIPVVKNKFNIGAGALLGTVIGLGEVNGGFGILYGIGTVGSRDKNFSIGLGYGYADGGLAERPAISFSGMLPVGRSNYLITENYLIENVALFSFGGRSLINRITLDYGVLLPTETGTFIGIPWLGIVIPIETKL